jgi:hypothetical protein
MLPFYPLDQDPVVHCWIWDKDRIINEISIDTHGILLDANETLIDINQTLIDINQISIDINGILIHIKEILVDIDDILININAFPKFSAPKTTRLDVSLTWGAHSDIRSISYVLNKIRCCSQRFYIKF